MHGTIPDILDESKPQRREAGDAAGMAMNHNVMRINGRRLRILVAIASYGKKNVGYLREIIATYRAFDADVEVVVVSNIPKELGPGVKVVVGLPNKNPWSLPFAHKQVFADAVEKHDLFIFSEDDMGITARNVQAFLEVAPHLAEDEIAGYIRYEVDPAGNRSLPEVHAESHWKPETVAQRGEFTVAEFTNEHAGYYILTQAQLRRAIASGGFLKAPYEGRYGWPETAATDPYTSCGFRKVICISALEGFLIHHMPNRYIGKLGVPLTQFQEQINTLTSIRDGRHPAATLCAVESNFLRRKWSKNLYEQPDAEVLKLLPGQGTILSVGSGWGATEMALKARGATITALPLDSVLGAGLQREGVEVIYGKLAECLEKLGGRKFDAVLMLDLLHLLPEPEKVLAKCAGFVREGGVFVLAGPNFNKVTTLRRRVAKSGDYAKLSSHEQSGIHVCGPRKVAEWLKHAGLRVTATKWKGPHVERESANGLRRGFASLLAETWILQAKRQ